MYSPNKEATKRKERILTTNSPPPKMWALKDPSGTASGLALPSLVSPFHWGLG